MGKSKEQGQIGETWPEKSGSMRYSPTPLQLEQDVLVLAVKRIHQDIHELDLTIQQYAYALEILQPSIEGKISIRFLQNRGSDSDSRHPTFIVWRKAKSGRFLYERIKPDKILMQIPRSAVFSLIRESLKSLLSDIRVMLSRRENALQAITSFRKQVGMQATLNKQANLDFDSKIRELLPIIKSERDKNLQNYVEVLDEAGDRLDEAEYISPSERPQVNPYGSVNTHRPKN